MKQPKGWMSIKSYKRGYLAAKKGKSKSSCPYHLCEDCQKILLKRTRWLMAHDDYSFRPHEMRNSKIDRKELEKIADICPEPRKKSIVDQHLSSKKKSKKLKGKKSKRHSLYQR